MRISVFHHQVRAWPMPKNHMDRRVCPTCKVTVHGSEAQRDHHNRHLEEASYRARVNELIEELAKRCGLTEELAGKLAGDDWSWDAEIEGSAEGD